MMSQYFMVSKTKFQHSVTITFFFARFSVRAISLRLFCENLINLRIFDFCFFFGAKDEHRTMNLTEIFLSVLEKLQLKHQSCFKKSMVVTQCQEFFFSSGTGGSKREERRCKMITEAGGHPQAEQMKMLSV